MVDWTSQSSLSGHRSVMVDLISTVVSSHYPDGTINYHTYPWLQICGPRSMWTELALLLWSVNKYINVYYEPLCFIESPLNNDVNNTTSTTVDWASAMLAIISTTDSRR